MKKVLVVIGVLVLAGMILAGVVWWCSRTSNPWNAATIGDISTPVGYTRVDGSYAEFMRSLPLKKRGSKVQLYTGGKRIFLCCIICRRNEFTHKSDHTGK